MFRAVSEAVEILQEAQKKCEDLYIESSESEDEKIKAFKVAKKSDRQKL